MSAITADSPITRSEQRPTRGSGVTFPRVVASEWIKIRSLRSTAWTLGVTVALMGLISLLAAWGTSSVPESEGGAMGLTMVGLVTTGYVMAQMTVAVLGVLVVSGEYSTGMVRSTFSAVPTRLPALGAKALVLAAVVAVTSVLGIVVAWAASLPWHDELGVTLDLADGEQLRVLGGTVLYLVTIALFALAVGTLVRHSAGGISAALGVILVLPIVMFFIPGSFAADVASLLPTTAGERLLSSGSMEGMSAAGGIDLTPWQGYGVMALWVVVLMTAAAVLLRRRDA